MKKPSIIFTVLIIFALTWQSPVCAQHNWDDLKGRARAEIQNSKALNLLTKGDVKGSLDQAINLLLDGTRADPTDPVPFATLGLALDQKNRYQEALNALSTSFRLDPKSNETLLSIAITHYLGHEYDKADRGLTRLLGTDPNFCKAHINLGFCLMKEGDFEKAKQEFNSAIKCNASSEPAYQGLALVDYLSGDLESAVREATYAESIHPYLPVTHLVAELAYLRGDATAYKSACQTLAKAKPPLQQRSMTQIGYLTQHDFHWDPYLDEEFDNYFGTMARALNLPDEASKQKSLSSRGKLQARLTSAQQAASTYPNDFYVLRQAALLNLAVGEYGSAAEQFSKAIGLCANDHVDYLYMGKALFLAGKAPEAAQCISQFLGNLNQTIAPEFAEIAKAAPAAPPQAVPTSTAPTTPTTPTTPVEPGGGF